MMTSDDLRRIRAERGLSQERAARSLCDGLRARIGPRAAAKIEPLLEALTPGQVTWCRWETGARRPDTVQAELLQMWADLA